MSWDIALSNQGDLIFSASRDIAGISGVDLIKQRIRIRLRLMRGAWIYDDTGTLGSNLHTLLSSTPDKAIQAAPAYTREALRGMDEITVDDVNIGTTDRSASVEVKFSVRVMPGETGGVNAAPEQQSVVIPLASIGGGF